jgi:uncharacterized protein
LTLAEARPTVAKMTTQTPQRDRDVAGIATDLAIIDTDLHATLPGVQALYPYLSDYWQETIADTAGAEWFNTAIQLTYPLGASTTRRPGVASLSSDSPTAPVVEATRTHAFGSWGCERAILSSVPFVNAYHNPDLAAAIASAVNDWVVTEWLEADERLLGSILVDPAHPALAVREIDRVGDHPQMVQIMLPARAAAPYGNRNYVPLFEAAARKNLVVAIHTGGWPGTAPSSSGWFSHYIEEFVSRAQLFQTHLMSMIAEGLFEVVPQTRVAMLEGGFAWLPSLLWRLDKDWKGLRRETPWVKQAPSAYVREHVRFSTQPFDGPLTSEHVALFIDEVGSEDLLMFSTDHPHWHYDAANEAIPPGIDAAVLIRLLATNARDFYRLKEN